MRVFIFIVLLINYFSLYINYVPFDNQYMLPSHLVNLTNVYKRKEPFVIRNGFLMETDYFTKFNNTYGNRTVYAIPANVAIKNGGGGHKTENMTLSQFMTHSNYKNYYMHTYQQFLDQQQYTDMFGLQFNILQNIPNAIYLGSQLFFSNKLQSGSSLHFAWGLNMFVQLKGKKRWVLINPKYAFELGCQFGNGGIYAMCPRFSKSLSESTIQSQLDLLPDYIPYYDFTLNEGDILINPDLWLHTIENVEAPTIALSLRYLVKNDNPLLHYYNYFNHITSSLKNSLVLNNKDQDSVLKLSFNYLTNTIFRKFDLDDRYSQFGIGNNEYKTKIDL